LEHLSAGSYTLDLAAAEDLVADLTRQYRFLHWHIEFPHIFRVGGGATGLDPATGWSGGFSCAIGNPPWEKVELKEQEFFARRSPWIANAPNAAERKKRIKQLLTSDDQADIALYSEFTREQRKSGGWAHLLKASGRYPLTGHGRLNTYAVFAETARAVIDSLGRSGMVLPTGIAIDAMTASYFGDLVSNAKLASLLDFENEAFLLSRAVHHDTRFCLLSICGRAARIEIASFAFGTRYMQDLPVRRFTMPPEEILLVNPNTGTAPLFRSRRDAEITIGIYKRIPVLWRDEPEENQWGISFMQGTFNMASDSGLFGTREDLELDAWCLTGNVFVRGNRQMLPLYEAKMIHHFDHRLGTYEGQTEAQANVGTLPRLTPEQHDDPDCIVMPRYWVDETEVDERLARRSWNKGWLLGWRDITNSNNERTIIAASIPRSAVGDKFLLAFTGANVAPLLANLTSFILDFCARQKIAGGASFKYYLFKQLPVLPPEAYSKQVSWQDQQALADWISQRVIELSYTANEMNAFAQDMGYKGMPFRWDEERRFGMRAELDALFFHLYGIERDDVDYVMDTFSIVKRKDEERYGSFRTKELILEIYEAMTEAVRSGRPYQTILNPPPGQGPRHG
jgi:hypothetical protein